MANSSTLFNELNIHLFGVVGEAMTCAVSWDAANDPEIVSGTISAITFPDGLPPGLEYTELTATTGTITGTPLEAVKTSFRVRVLTNVETPFHTFPANIYAAEVTETPALDPTVVADQYALECNFELANRTLTFPGSNEAGDDGSPGLVLYQNEQFDLAILPTKQEVIQDLDYDEVIVTFKHFEVENSVALNQSAIFSEANSRLFTRVSLPQSLLGNLIARGTDTTDTYIDGTLQIELAKSGFTGSDSDTATVSEDHDQTFAQALDLDAVWDAGWGDYPIHLTFTFTCPGDPSLDMSFVYDLVVYDNAGTYAIRSQSGETSDSSTATEEGDWGADLALTSVVGSGTGLTVNLNLTTDEQNLTTREVTVTPENAINASDPDYLDASTYNETWDFIGAGESLLYQFDSSSAALTMQDIEDAIETGLSLDPGTITVTNDANFIYVEGLPATVLRVDVADTDGSNSGAAGEFNTTLEPDPTAPSYASCVVATTMAAGPSSAPYEERFIAQKKVRIKRDH